MTGSIVDCTIITDQDDIAKFKGELGKFESNDLHMDGGEMDYSFRFLEAGQILPSQYHHMLNFNTWLHKCEVFQEQNLSQKGANHELHLRQKRAWWTKIFGFNWCGPGNASKHYNDLGWHAKTDACCRDHDHCNRTIAPGEHSGEYDKTNDGWFTMSHCETR